jgi:hypothetical protein
MSVRLVLKLHAIFSNMQYMSTSKIAFCTHYFLPFDALAKCLSWHIISVMISESCCLCVMLAPWADINNATRSLRNAVFKLQYWIKWPVGVLALTNILHFTLCSCNSTLIYGCQHGCQPHIKNKGSLPPSLMSINMVLHDIFAAYWDDDDEYCGESTDRGWNDWPCIKDGRYCRRVRSPRVAVRDAVVSAFFVVEVGMIATASLVACGSKL